MRRLPPSSTRTNTLFPYPPLFRSVESVDGPDQPVYVTGQLSTALRHLLVKRGRRESFLTTYPVFDCSPHWGFEIFWIVGKHPWAKFFRIDLRQMAYL